MAQDFFERGDLVDSRIAVLLLCVLLKGGSMSREATTRRPAVAAATTDDEARRGQRFERDVRAPANPVSPRKRAELIRPVVSSDWWSMDEETWDGAGD